MQEQMQMMESTMIKNINTLQQMSSKNIKFIESSVKMAQAEATEQRKQMVQMVKNAQQRSSKMAQGRCGQVKQCSTSHDDTVEHRTV